MKNDEKNNYLKTGEITPEVEVKQFDMDNMIQTAVLDNRITLLNFGSLTKTEQNIFIVLVSLFKQNQKVAKIDLSTL